MAKRIADSEDSPHRKRQKITNSSPPAKDQNEIRSSRDLQLLLAFDQDVGPAVRQSKNHLEHSCKQKEATNENHLTLV